MIFHFFFWSVAFIDHKCSSYSPPHSFTWLLRSSCSSFFISSISISVIFLFFIIRFFWFRSLFSSMDILQSGSRDFMFHTPSYSCLLLCPRSCVFIFLLRFHVSTLRSSTACLFSACHGRMPQPVLTCASVVVQLVTSVDGEFDGGIWCSYVSWYKCCVYSFKKK